MDKEQCNHDLQQQYEYVLNRYTKANELMSDPSTTEAYKAKWMPEYEKVYNQLLELEKLLDVSNDNTKEIESLFKSFIDRMCQIEGWDTDTPGYIKSSRPELYANWNELEYRLDERWGMCDLDGFKETLKQYETVCLQIWKMSGRGVKR